MAAHVAEGNLDAQADAFTWPLVIYLNGNVLIELSRAETLRSLALTQTSISVRGIERVETHVAGHMGPLDDRFSVDVLWTYFKDLVAVATGEVRYFGRFDANENVSIEMVEYQHVPFPELVTNLTSPGYDH
ncbi:MAG: hypothetical protein AAGA71_04405 [Pseudomonadota bacterium]